jgi:release factor glutamine methyltransferase
MCTGSGCILLSLLLRTKAGGGTGCDISEPALYVAAENAQRLGVTNVHFVQGNLFEQIHDTYDMIVSNPPYIRTDVIAGLMEEVIGHEPYLALNGHEDGLYFYRRITKESVCFLKNGGYLCYEIGYDQAADVADIMKNNDFEEIRVIKDLAGLDRVVIGRRRN